MKNNIALAFSLLVSSLAVAQASAEKTPISFDLITYGAVIAVSLVAGLLTAIPRYLADETARHQWLRLAYDLIGAVFVGVMAFWLCQAREMSMLYTMPMVMVSAVSGVGGIKAARRLLANMKERPT